MSEKLYPMMVRLKGKRVVIVGGGKIALRKVKGLIDTGAMIEIVSPQIVAELKNMPDIHWIEKEFSPSDVKDAQIVFAATNSKAVNRQVVSACNEAQFVNDVSESERSTFMNMAVVEQGPVKIAISTQGESPQLAKEIKKEIEETIHSSYIEKMNLYKQRRKKNERNN